MGARPVRGGHRLPIHEAPRRGHLGFDGSDPEDNPLESNIHATNESVSIRTLVTSTKVMLALAYEMLAVR